MLAHLKSTSMPSYELCVRGPHTPTQEILCIQVDVKAQLNVTTFKCQTFKSIKYIEVGAHCSRSRAKRKLERHRREQGCLQPLRSNHLHTNTQLQTQTNTKQI